MNEGFSILVTIDILLKAASMQQTQDILPGFKLIG